MIALLFGAVLSAQPASFAVVESSRGELGFYSIEGVRVAGVAVAGPVRDMIVSADGKTAYIAAEEINVIDMVARVKTATFSAGRIMGLVFLPKTGQLLAAAQDPDGLLLIDPKEGKVVQRFTGEGQSPHSVTVDARGEWAYVSNAASSTVDAIQLGSGFVRRIITDAAPGKGVFTKDGRLLFVSHPEGSSISIIDTQRRQKVGALFSSRGPVSVGMSSDGLTLLAASRGRSAVVFTDASTREEIVSVEIGGRPGSMALSRFGSSVFVTLPERDKVVVISLSKPGIVQIIDVAPSTGLGAIIPAP